MIWFSFLFCLSVGNALFIKFSGLAEWEVLCILMAEIKKNVWFFFWFLKLFENFYDRKCFNFLVFDLKRIKESFVQLWFLSSWCWNCFSYVFAMFWGLLFIYRFGLTMDNFIMLLDWDCWGKNFIKCIIGNTLVNKLSIGQKVA